MWSSLLPWIVACLPLPVPSTGPGPALSALPRCDDDRATLQELLALARERREELHARLRDELQVVFARIEAEPLPATKSRRGLLSADLVAMGAESTPLLVPWLDPGLDPADRARFRAALIAAALERMDTAAVTTELLRLLDTGSDEGRRLSLRVLGHTPEPARVRPALVALYDRSEGTLREATLRTLIELPGESHALLASVLEGTDAKLVDMALAALTDARSTAAVDEVRALLGSVGPGSRHAQALLAFFQAVPSAVGEAEILAFLRLANESSLATDIRIGLIDALPAFGPSPSTAVKKQLEPIVQANNRKIAESGLVMLAVMGDRGARKELLSSYDDFVDRNSRWAPAYARRAEILRRIRDLDDAIKDYKRALELGREDPAAQADTYIGLARCYALKGKLRDAREYLRTAPINLEQLRALALDPDFQELREHSRYGDVFPEDA